MRWIKARKRNKTRNAVAPRTFCVNWLLQKSAKKGNLIPTLEEAFRQTVPSVIVVPVDYSENMKLSAHLKEVYRQSET